MIPFSFAYSASSSLPVQVEENTMLIITAHKHSANQVRFEFDGSAAHTEVAIAALQQGSRSQRLDTPSAMLIVNVSSAVLHEIASLSCIESVDGTPFIPLFLPHFGQSSEPLPATTPSYFALNVEGIP